MLPIGPSIRFAAARAQLHRQPSPCCILLPDSEWICTHHNARRQHHGADKHASSKLFITGLRGHTAEASG